MQNWMRYICQCIHTGGVRGWLDGGQQTCASSCRTLPHYGSNQMIARSPSFLPFGPHAVSLALVCVTLAARKQRRKLTSWLHVPQVPLLCCSSVQSASCLRASRNKWLLRLMNYKGLWKQAAKISFNVLSGHGTLAQEAGIPAFQSRDERLRLSTGCRETLRCYPTHG